MSSDHRTLVERAARELNEAGLDETRLTAHGARNPYRRHPAVSIPSLLASVDFKPRPVSVRFNNMHGIARR